MSTPVSHLDLLVTARAVQRAAVDDDLGTVHAELRHLREEFIGHVCAERRAQMNLPDATRRVVHHGHRHLLRLIEELLSATTETRDCTCLVRAARLRSALTRQARLEANLLRVPPRRRSSPPSPSPDTGPAGAGRRAGCPGREHLADHRLAPEQLARPERAWTVP